MFKALTLPERSILLGIDIDFAESADMNFFGEDLLKDWLLVHSVLLTTLREWEVEILLESN